MMPLFIVNFGGTLDGLGEVPEEGEEETSIVDSVAPFVMLFGIIGAVAGLTGFTMVTVWTIAGERQVHTHMSCWLWRRDVTTPTAWCFVLYEWLFFFAAGGACLPGLPIPSYPIPSRS